MKVSVYGQQRGVTETIRRDQRRGLTVGPRSSATPGASTAWAATSNCDHGDAANAVLAAAGDNFRMLLTWLAILRRVFVMAALAAASEAVLTTVGHLSIRCPKHNRQRILLLRFDACKSALLGQRGAAHATRGETQKL